MLRERDCSFVTEKLMGKHYGEKLTIGSQETEVTLEDILDRYCPLTVSREDLQKKLEIFLLREFYKPTHGSVQRSAPTRVWFRNAVVQLIDRPKIISIVTAGQKGVSYDVCIPVKKYLREAFGIEELQDLYNNVILESQDLQEVSCKILTDLELWLDIIELDREGKAEADKVQIVKSNGVCGKALTPKS